MNHLVEDAKVTVVIPTYNRCDLITRAITSVLNQTFQEWKILVIDDGSIDGTEQVVSDMMVDDQRISYYRMPRNAGQAHALNTALQMINTKYMIQLDSDDWLENHTLEKLVSAMEKEPETTAMAYGNYTVWTRKKPIYETLRPFTNKEKYEFISYGPTLCPRFFRTSCLRAVGGWDTHDRFEGRYVEDRRIMYKLIGKYDFCWVNENLYNINRLVNRNIQLTRNVRACNEVKREAILVTLKNWGDEYVPRFSFFRGGWLKTTLVPKTAATNGNRHNPRRKVRKRFARVRRLRVGGGVRRLRRGVRGVRRVRKVLGVRRVVKPTLRTARIARPARIVRSSQRIRRISKSRRPLRRKAKKQI